MYQMGFGIGYVIDNILMFLLQSAGDLLGYPATGTRCPFVQSYMGCPVGGFPG